MGLTEKIAVYNFGNDRFHDYFLHKSRVTAIAVAITLSQGVRGSEHIGCSTSEWTLLHFDFFGVLRRQKKLKLAKRLEFHIKMFDFKRI